MTQSTEIAPIAAADTDRFAGLKTFWHYYSVNRGAVIGLVVFVLLVIVAILAPVLAPHLPYEQDKSAFLTPPVWETGGNPAYLLGTDPVGRDILSRLLYGARFSLLIGAFVVTLALVGGITLGLLAGYFRGWVDVAIMRLMDLILAFPSLLLALVLVTILGPGLFNAMLAIALVLQPHFARLTRGAVIHVKVEDYIEAARALGASPLRQALRHVLPNIAAPLIVQATLAIAAAVIAEASLSFLGLGQQAPAPSWGSMLNTAKNYVDSAPWMAIWPGLSIFLLVLAFNLLGDGLRDALDPRQI